MAKRQPKSEQLRKKIATMEAELKAEKAKEESARMTVIEQVARKLGILDRDIPKGEIEAALRVLLPAK